MQKAADGANFLQVTLNLLLLQAEFPSEIFLSKPLGDSRADQFDGKHKNKGRASMHPAF
jgi:hypothetical protein